MQSPSRARPRGGIMQHNSGIFKCLNIFHLNQIFSAEERGCERAAGDVADLQAHEAGQAHHSLQGADTPAQVPTRHLRVSYILHLTLATMFRLSTTISLYAEIVNFY